MQTDPEDPDQADMTQLEPATEEGKKPVDLAEAEAAVAAEEGRHLQHIKEEIKKAIEESPDLKELEQNLKIDQTEDGIRIQLLDQEKVSMFPSGSAAMNPRSQELLSKVALAIKDLPNKLEISGHTDSTPYPGGRDYTNWELSTDRANASRRVLVGAGITTERLKIVQGRADTDPFVRADPFDPQNRRISIVLLREPKPAPAPVRFAAPASSSSAPAAKAEPPAELVP